MGLKAAAAAAQTEVETAAIAMKGAMTGVATAEICLATAYAAGTKAVVMTEMMAAATAELPGYLLPPLVAGVASLAGATE